MNEHQPVTAIGDWATNAQMIKAISPLGYLDGAVLDATFGRGLFWTEWRPSQLTTNDIHPDRGDCSFSVTEPPPSAWISKFDAAVFDPPYRMSGARDLGDFDDRYGLDMVADRDVPALLEACVVFGSWVTAKKGRVLVKCQDQQWSGKLFEQTDVVRQAGKRAGLRVVDRFHMVGKVRAQPAGRPQRSARNNYSTLVVLGR